MWVEPAEANVISASLCSLCCWRSPLGVEACFDLTCFWRGLCSLLAHPRLLRPSNRQHFCLTSRVSFQTAPVAMPPASLVWYRILTHCLCQGYLYRDIFSTMLQKTCIVTVCISGVANWSTYPCLWWYEDPFIHCKSLRYAWLICIIFYSVSVGQF